MQSPNILLWKTDRETLALIAKYLRTNACNVTTATGRDAKWARAMGRPPRRPFDPRRDAAG